MQGVIFLAGPNGVGKSSIAHELEKISSFGYQRVIRYTSRNKRKSEKDGKAYHFVSNDKFKSLVNKDAFIQWEKLPQGYYGTALKSITNVLKNNHVAIIDSDTPTCLEMVDNLETKGISTLVFFVIPISKDVLKSSNGVENAIEEIEHRMEKQKRTESYIAERLQYAKIELKQYQELDFIIENSLGNFSNAVDEIDSITRTHLPTS